MMILSADIGGTHSRFGVFDLNEDGSLTLLKCSWIETASHNSFTTLLREVAETEAVQSFSEIRSVVVAVPGPVRNGRAPVLPNVTWSVDISELQICMPSIANENLHLINDFVAQAMVCEFSRTTDGICVQSGEKDPKGVLSIMGAGTGLGFCSVLRNQIHGISVLASEAGHHAFPFQGSEERLYEDFLRKTTGKSIVDGNIVVSGRGLACLYQFYTGQELTPQEVSVRLTPTCDVTCTFAKFYGRLARHYVLSTLSTRGLYVTGGVAAKNTYLVHHDVFRSEFSTSQAHHQLLKRIPIWINVNELSGLWGAAYYAKFFSQGKSKGYQIANV